MASNAQITLGGPTAARLGELVNVNLDSAEVFEDAAKSVSDARLSRVFQDLATQRREFAAYLRGIVGNEEAPEPGTIAGQLREIWLDVRKALSGGEPHAMLCEIERSESRIEALYEAALDETAGSPIHEHVVRQHALVRRAHDRIGDLRDGWKSKGG